MFWLRNSSTTAAWALRSSPSKRGVQTWTSADFEQVVARRRRPPPVASFILSAWISRSLGLELLAQLRVLVDQVAPVDLGRLLQLLQDALVRLGARHRRLAGEGLHPPGARGDALLGGDQEEADLARSARTWVPPQNSLEKPGTSTTRTRSPYLSPKKARAP